MEPHPKTYPASRRLAAMAVHLLTASGVLWALLALGSVAVNEFQTALLWLGVALAVDGVDGTLARKAEVKAVLPRIDGDALDLVVDYLNYVLVPAALMWAADLLPRSVALAAVAAILLSSLYVFARRDMKTHDQYFRGFPALWNVVAAYLFVAGLGALANLVVVAVLVALTFAPIHVVHPFRSPDWRPWPLILAAAWLALTAGLLVPGLDPALHAACVAGSLLAAALLIMMGLLRTARGSRAGTD